MKKSYFVWAGAATAAAAIAFVTAGNGAIPFVPAAETASDSNIPAGVTIPSPVIPVRPNVTTPTTPRITTPTTPKVTTPKTPKPTTPTTVDKEKLRRDAERDAEKKRAEAEKQSDQAQKDADKQRADAEREAAKKRAEAEAARRSAENSAPRP